MQPNSKSQIQPVFSGAIGKASTTDPKAVPLPPQPHSDPPIPVSTTNIYYGSSNTQTPDYGYGVMAPVTVTPEPVPTPPIVEPEAEKKEIKGLWGMDLGTTLTVAIAAAGLLFIIYSKQNTNGNTTTRIKK